MWKNPHDAYLESRILSAEPLELVRLLYQACTGSVREARRHLADGEIAARSACISRAYGILLELTASLDHGVGGDLSRRLAALYDYMQRKLLEANHRQSDGPLAEVLGLLSTLAEAWDAIGAPVPVAEPAAGAWAQPPVEAPTHGWSL